MGWRNGLQLKSGGEAEAHRSYVMLATSDTDRMAVVSVVLFAVPAFVILDKLTLKCSSSLSYPCNMGMTGVMTSVTSGEEQMRKCMVCSSLELGPSRGSVPVAGWSSQALASLALA